MVSASTLHDESALDVTALPEKVIAESIPEPSSVVNDDVDRIDVEDPRADVTVEEETLVEDVATAKDDADMTSDDAQKILDRYGFGAGMQMYARSLALAELQEKERAAKAKAAAEFKAEKEALLKAKEETSSRVLPSVTSVIDFETVRSELSKVVQSIASLGSMDYLNQDKNAKNEKGVALDDEDEDDVMDEASREDIRSSGQGCCGAEEALTEIFREAEVWAEAAYKKMSADKTYSSMMTKSTSKKSWWPTFLFQRKDKQQVTESLRLDECSDTATGSNTAKKNWWESILCAPVILDENHEAAKPDSTLTPVTN